MVTEAAERILPVEIGFQLLFVFRMGRDDIKRIVGNIIVETEPFHTGATRTDDGRALRVTFVWDAQPNAVDARTAWLRDTVTNILADVYPGVEIGALEQLEEGAEFRNPTILRFGDR